MAANHTRRMPAIDIARLVLACIVVLGHADFLKDIHVPTYAAFANGFARVVVPFFLITSGFFFDALMRNGPRLWSAKVLRLYLFWTAVFLPLVVLIGDFSAAKLGFYIVTGYAHLWYLPALLGAGLVLWVVRDWSTTRILRLAGGFFVAGLAIQVTLNYVIGFDNLTHRNAWITLSRNFLFFGFPFMAAGYLLKRDQFLGSVSTPALFAIMGFGLAIIGLEALIAYRVVILGGFFDLVAGAIIFTPALFEFLTRLKPRIRTVGIGALAAAIYFIHPLFVYPLQHWVGLEPILRAPISLALSVLAAFLLIRFNRIVPVV